MPQRDGVESNKTPFSEMMPDERRRAMFEMDRDLILECNIFLFILDGRVPDEGACVELGIAYAHRFLTKTNKFIIGFQSDNRAAFISSKLNPMLKMSFDVIVES